MNMKELSEKMSQFTGTKTVNACRMSRKEAEKVIGRKVYNDSEDREDEEGYLVKYADDYLSWSPRKTFEDAYSCSETFLERMLIEHKEVKERYIKGREFSFTQAFRQLSDEERGLLRKQLDQMEGYLYTLTKRIEVELSETKGRSE